MVILEKWGVGSGHQKVRIDSDDQFAKCKVGTRKWEVKVGMDPYWFCQVGSGKEEVELEVEGEDESLGLVLGSGEWKVGRDY